MMHRNNPRKVMNVIIRSLSLMVCAPLTLMAIEPPVDSEPIPPQEPPADARVEIRPGPAVQEAQIDPLPMPAAEEVRPFLGVILDPVPDLLAGHLKLKPGEGVVIGDLVAGGPAEKAQLSVGDVLTEVDGVGVGSPEAVRAEVDKHKVGDEVEVSVIQKGQQRKASITLGEAPEGLMGGVGQPGQPNAQLDGFLENFPDRHADLIREALERNLRAFEDLEGDGGAANQLQMNLMQRLEKEMGANGGMQLKLGGDVAAQSSIRLLDEEGSIEMSSRDGHKEARVYDQGGKLLWEGPYDTPQDKAAVPDGIRERLEKLNFDMDFGGNGLKLRLGPNRFRPLDELEAPEPLNDDDGE